MPRYANHSFREWFFRRRSPWRDRPAPNGRVVYFHGCSVQFMEPHIGRHVVEVLEHNGFEVVLPPQKCCGLPLIANGDLKAAAGTAGTTSSTCGSGRSRGCRSSSAPRPVRSR
ncbi:MAG: hypothetical protein A6D92_07075 [Symbiobacterium thermophilum]|uniref:Cysteine-rich domain-containing protein n=1 Tax=Symbiobacterium thermophilum TaxID=2734 RepID=A0A1Y2T4J0_SYMTR|nr:MAG: hypothetical protein A6D92_07075 [Symbiobacterium thermophilum]